MSNTLLEVRRMSKSYAGQQVLLDVSLSFRSGAIHALVGENGAGKSTLAGMIAGWVSPSSGSILIDDEHVDYSSPRQARQRGIAFVTQELSLLPQRSVIENVFSGQMPTAMAGIVSKRKMREKFDALLAATRLDLSPHQRADELNAVQQEFVEILRAVASGVRLLILDEPTTATTPDQAEQIYDLMRKLASQGVAVVLISHDLDDVLRIADDVSVLRDGKLVAQADPSLVSKQALIKMMIGRDLGELFPPKRRCSPDSPVVLSLEGLTRAGQFQDISLHVCAGEILGVAGLVGSGRSEVLMSVFGATPAHAGTICVNGRAHRVRSVRQAQGHGIALVPESRKSQGLHLDHSIERNISLASLRSISRWGLVNPRASRAAAHAGIARTGLKAPSFNATIRTLSGGNQQRALFAKWLVNPPAVLLVDEPTKGVDVKGKHAIYQILVELAAQGSAVIVVSSVATELIGLSHRVVVLHQGALAAELTDEDITEGAIVHAAFGELIPHLNGGVLR